jgi:hypothetical protein
VEKAYFEAKVEFDQAKRKLKDDLTHHNPASLVAVFETCQKISLFGNKNSDPWKKNIKDAFPKDLGAQAQCFNVISKQMDGGTADFTDLCVRPNEARLNAEFVGKGGANTTKSKYQNCRVDIQSVIAAHGRWSSTQNELIDLKQVCVIRPPSRPDFDP